MSMTSTLVFWTVITMSYEMDVVVLISTYHLPIKEVRVITYSENNSYYNLWMLGNRAMFLFMVWTGKAPICDVDTYVSCATPKLGKYLWALTKKLTLPSLCSHGSHLIFHSYNNMVSYLSAAFRKRGGCVCNQPCKQTLYVPSLSFASLTFNDETPTQEEQQRMDKLRAHLTEAREITYRCWDLLHYAVFWESGDLKPH